MNAELTDETVAQVPDAAITSGNTAGDDGGGISPLVWILIAIVLLGGVSGVVAMRARGKSDAA